jgi:transposase
VGAEHLGYGERRQVIDLPPEIVLEVIDHVNVVRLCACCGQVSAGAFPDGVGAQVQYGPRTRALGVYLVVFQHIPYERAARTLDDLAELRVSTGSLKAWVDQAAGGLTEFDEQLRALLSDAPVCHFDETGARIAGRLAWIHSASTTTLTRYTAHARRGTEAMDDAGVLPTFRGMAVHDGCCAARRSVVSPAQPGITRRNVIGSNGLPRSERQRGQSHARKGTVSSGVRAEASRDPCDMAKARLPDTPISRRWNVASAGTTPETGAMLCDGLPAGSLQPSERGALPSEGNQGDEWGAYVTLGRTTETNAGLPTGREPHGNGVLIVVVRVTPHQGGRESRQQGEGAQATGHLKTGRYA